MKVSKTIGRPANWQDFESLCKKLWGEIWDCAEIKKNGRLGDAQKGVDVYGIPAGQSQYFGIQCKGKDVYTNKQFTETEVTECIEEAKKFQPQLKKLYLATTAVKNADIEEFVRKKDMENRAKGLFEVHIFSWEDIVDYIDENKKTYDWYVRSLNYQTSARVSVTFQNDLTELVICPKFKKTITNYKQKAIPLDPYQDPLRFFMNREPMASVFSIETRSDTINLSYSPFFFKIKNIGTDAIEESKLIFDFKGEIDGLSETNILQEFPLISKYMNKPDVFLWTEPMSGEIIPERKILVGDDIYRSDDIFIKPQPKEYEVLILWKLISKNFKSEGELKIIVQPDITLIYKDILVSDPFKVKIEQSPIEDFVENWKTEAK